MVNRGREGWFNVRSIGKEVGFDKRECGLMEEKCG